MWEVLIGLLWRECLEMTLEHSKPLLHSVYIKARTRYRGPNHERVNRLLTHEHRV